MTIDGLRMFAAAALLVAGVAAGVYLVQQPGVSAPETQGVTQALARERAQRIRDVEYDLKLRVPGDRTAPIQGSISVTFTLSNARRPLVFDFAQPADHLLAVTVNEQRSTATVQQGHIVIPAEGLIEGPNRITFEFTAGDEPLNRQDDLLYSLFVPARASSAFPCFDQPDLKARWRLALDVPRGWTAVSNGREAGRANSGDHTGFLFDVTEPISTYLFAFAAGRFEIETIEKDGRAWRVFHRETDRTRIARNRDEIVDQHAHALSWMADYTGIPYRFGKFDIVLIPSFQFGGMEHPGAVFYNADSVLLDESATQARLLARANVIAHETAHMWFGDLVTMSWFDDVWMKEVLANFMAARIVNPAFPEMDHELRFLVQHYPAAYDVDRTDGANPIRQGLRNLDEAGSLYGAIIYQKAPIVLRQLELLVGPDNLREGLREYLVAHEFGNASWPDLIDVLDRRTPHDLAAWSRAWVEEAGRPTLSTDLRTEEGTIVSLTIRQSDQRGRDLVWPQQLQVVLGYGAVTRTLPVTIANTDVQIAAAAGLPAPDWVLPMGHGLGYGAVIPDDRTRAWLTDGVEGVDTALTRAAAAITRWEAMLDGQIAPAAVFEALLKEIGSERDPLTLQLLLDQCRALFWRFLPSEERADRARRLEPALVAGLERSPDMSTKAMWFAAIRSTAVSGETIAWLEDIWARRASIRGLQLSETDDIDLVMDLAVRDDIRGAAMIAAQIARTKDAERRAKLDFIAPALSPDPSSREAFFDRLSDVTNRAREAWVLDAVRYLHHPMRADASARLVIPALSLLPELQRTGDIFFPKRWADATLSGHQSTAMAADVQAFLESLPLDYPSRLRWVLLASADPLFRAAALSQH